MFKKLLILIFVLGGSSAFASDFALKNARYGVGYLFLSQSTGGDVSSGNLIAATDFWSMDSYGLSLEGTVSAYLDSSVDQVFYSSGLRILGSYCLQDSSWLPQVFLGSQLWEGRGVKADYGVGLEHGISDLPMIGYYVDFFYIRVGKIQHNVDTSFVNIGILKHF